MVADDAAFNSVEVALATLQPIRDLAKNWDIDIASCLEEYLHELIGDLTEEQRRNLPQQTESLNFSQAALVLQNSSNVYSRKVEYLYSLVYKALEELNKSTVGNKDGAAGNSGRKTSTDAAIDEFNNFDPHVDFLLLDDVLPMDQKGTKINLTEESGDNGPGGRGYDPGLSFATAATTTRLSLGGTLSATTATERSAIIAAQSTAQQVVLGSLDMGSLHLLDGRCDVGEDGVLLMPGTAPAPGQACKNNYCAGGGLSHSPATSLQGESALSEGGDDNVPMVDGYDNYDDHDNDGPGFAFADDDDGGYHPMATGNMNESTATPKRGTSSKLQKQPEDDVPLKKDPWEMLDPHSQGSTSKRSKPLRVGKTLKLPPGVQNLPSASTNQGYTTKGAPTKAKFSKEKGSLAVAAFKFQLAALKQQTEKAKRRSDSQEDDSTVDDIESEGIVIPMKGLMYGSEFMYIARATAKRKKAERQEERKLLSKLATGSSEVEDEPAEDHEEDDYAPFGFGDGGDDGSVGGMQLAGDDDGLGNTGFATVDVAFGHDGDADDVSNADGKNFEELCRSHIQAFARGAEAYAAETRLSKRVGQWHEQLMPILEDEESRPEFDIHAYGRRVVSSIENEFAAHQDGDRPTKVFDFNAVTRNCPHYDVCRLFLASLSLSNSGNVKLVHDGSGDCSRLGIKLLSNQIDRPMETYLAPSVSDET